MNPNIKSGRGIIVRYCLIRTALALIITSLLVAVAGCAGGKSAAMTGKLKVQKEVLVARDIGGGQPFVLRGWCGNDGLLMDSEISGKEWLGLNGKRVVVSKKKTDYLTG